MLKGHSNPEDLSELERYRFHFVMAASFESHQTMFLQHSGSSVSPALWDYYRRQFDGYCRTPGVAQWWKPQRSRFDPAFAQYVDEKTLHDD